MGTVLPFANCLASIPDGRPLDLVEFDRERLKAYAALALFAPQEVVSAHDRIVDYLFDCAEEKQAYGFSRVRDLATTALNKARADLGIKGEIRYLGARRQDTASTM